MRRLLTGLVLLLAGACTQAHVIAAGQGTIRLVDRSAFVMISVPAGALAGFDDNHDGRIDRAEIDAHRGMLDMQVSALLELEADGVRGDLGFSDLLLPAGDAAPAGEIAVMRVYSWRAHPRHVSVRVHLFHADATRDGQLALRVIDGAHSEAVVLSRHNPEHGFFNGSLATFRSFAGAGVRHILAGPDHLLFLLTILVVAGSWRYWLAIVTAFTVAHSVTLALTAFDIIAAPPALVEPLIAASIVYMAVDNLARGMQAARHRLALVFAFGLLHGMGIASALAELGINDDTRLAGLVGFNLGVEAGQLMFVGGVVVALAALRRFTLPQWQIRATQAASVAAALVGGWWLVERTLA
ncbi:MAG: HupE/UreJ family protein [Telluria sp.]